MSNTTRAMHEVQSDAMRLINIRLLAAVEACEWLSVHQLSHQLCEIAERGLYHAAMERQGDIAKFAMGDHIEPEPR